MFKPLIFAGSVNEEQETSVYMWASEGGTPEEVPLYSEYIRHSLTGFDWGDITDGSLQLAYALLFSVLMFSTPYGESVCDELASTHHRMFCDEVIAKLPLDGWQLSEESIREWLREAVHI